MTTAKERATTVDRRVGRMERIEVSGPAVITVLKWQPSGVWVRIEAKQRIEIRHLPAIGVDDAGESDRL